MTKQITFTLVVIATCILTSCKSTININQYVDKALPFGLTITTTDSATGLTKLTHMNIEVNSVKYVKLINWFDKNQDGWRTTPASYVTNIGVTQGAFRLLYTRNSVGALIGFTDKENKARQYSKTIKRG